MHRHSPQDVLFRQEASLPPLEYYLKKTVLRSSIVVGFFSNFSVRTNKPLEGLVSSSVNDEKDQTLHASEHDSYFGADLGDDDDALIMGLNSNDIPFARPEPPEYTNVNIVARSTSLVVEGVEYGLNSAVTDVVRLCEGQNSEQGEDLLLLSLRTGFLLLIRIWKVPRTYCSSGLSSHENLIPETMTLHVYKPFVVQWWKLEDRCGGELGVTTLSYHPEGLAVVAASSQSVFRIFLPEPSDFGLGLSTHFNVPVDGVILHSCFAHPILALNLNTQILFLTVTFSEEKRLVLTLYSWFVAELLTGNLRRSALPLNNTYAFPIMVISLKCCCGFLLVFPVEFVIVTPHNIWSADYSFHKYPYNGLFPTSFFCTPKQRSKSSSDYDEVFLATESGIIYRITISQSYALESLEFVRIGDLIAVFTIRDALPLPGYALEYSSDNGSAKKVYIAEPLSAESSAAVTVGKTPYSQEIVVNDLKGWSPVIDFVLVDLQRPAPLLQQMWALTGHGKRTKLTQLLSQHLVRKETECYKEIRKFERLFSFQVDNRHFLVASSSLSSKLMEYKPIHNGLDKVPITEIELSCFETDHPTLLCAVAPGTELMMQILPTGVLFTDFKTARFEKFGQKILLRCSLSKTFAALVFKRGSEVTLEVHKIKSDVTLDDLSEELFFDLLFTKSIDADVSSIAIFAENLAFFLAVGRFSGNINLIWTDYVGHSETLFTIALQKASSWTRFTSEPCVPYSYAYLPDMRTLYIGTQRGMVYAVKVEQGSQPTIINSFKLGFLPVRLVFCAHDPHFLFAISSSLWVFNFYCGLVPQPASFNERIDRLVVLMAELPSAQRGYLRFAFSRDDGLVVGSIFLHRTGMVKQVSVGESAKKLLFYDTAGVFVMMCRSKDMLKRLAFVERRSLRLLSSTHFPARETQTELVFALNEVPLCGHVWTIMRSGGVLKKLIIGCLVEAEGSLKILDIRKKHSPDRIPMVIEVVELYTIRHERPINSVCQLDSTIFFCSSVNVFSTEYLTDQKRLGELQLVAQLPSEVISLEVFNGKLHVSTLLDSVFKFAPVNDESTPIGTGGTSKWILCYSDPIPRSLVNHFEVDDRIFAGDKRSSCFIVMDTSKLPRMEEFCFHFPFIPRIYASRLHYTEEAAKLGLPLALCVGVNGDIVEMSVIHKNDQYLKRLNENIKEKYNFRLGKSVTKLMEILSRPFAEKVTGKGLQNLYRPFFGYNENLNDSVDWDVDELAYFYNCGFTEA